MTTPEKPQAETATRARTRMTVSHSLEITSGPMDGHRVRIHADATRIGTGADCDFRVSLDPQVRGHHAVLEGRENDDAYLVRASVDAIVLHNGKPLLPDKPLSPGAEFVIGQTWIQIVGPEPMPAPSPGLEIIGRLDPASHQVLNNATARAEKRGALHLGVDDLFMAMGPSSGLIRELLMNAGVDVVAFLARLNDEIHRRRGSFSNRELVFTSRLLRVFGIAAATDNDGRLEPMELFHAIVGEARSLPMRLLRELGVDLREKIETRATTHPSTVPKTGPTPTLDQIGRDLTALAAEGRLGPLIGRQNELRQILEILARKHKNNPLIIGPSGVGKTRLVEGLAQLAVRPDAPDLIRNRRIIEISPGALVAGTMFRGQMEERVMAMVKEAAADPRVVLFFDEMHALLGAGRGAEGALDAANILKPALSRGDFVCIGASTHAEYRQFIEKDRAMDRRFDPVIVAEPSPEDAEQILRGVVPYLEQHHKVTFAADAIPAAVHLSVRHLPERHLPDKALDLLDRAAARVRIGALVGGSGPVASINADQIAGVLSELIGRPVHAAAGGEAEVLMNLEAELGKRIYGQSEALEALGRILRMSRAGLKNPRRPEGVFLFLGPTGVGKTETARQLAALLYADESSLVRFDMSEFKEPHSVAKLLGAPPGYVGYDQGGALTEAVRRRPACVLLFDEIEKACDEVFDLFLQLFDDGRLTDAQGRTTDFRGATIIMTSNIAIRGAEKSIVGFGKPEDSAPPDEPEMRRRLEEHFRPEWINRIDAVVTFRGLAPDVLRRIVDARLVQPREQLQARGLTLEVDEPVYDFICSQADTERFGARELARVVERTLLPALAQAILKAGKGGRVVATVKSGALSMEPA